MIAHRVMPFFLLKGKRLVKGTNFKGHIDVGDPLSQAMIYDAQGADEIVVVDISASLESRLIDTKVINDMISRCRLPITVGGGVKSLRDAHKCFKAGADKILINTNAILRPSFIKELAREFGSQSVVVSMDVRKNRAGCHEVYLYSGTVKAKEPLIDLVKKAIDNGAGELVITSIDMEGTLKGYDIDLYKKLRNLIRVPAIASGGAGCYDDVVKLFKDTDFDACAIGKMFFLRDYDVVKVKSYLNGKHVMVRET